MTPFFNPWPEIKSVRAGYFFSKEKIDNKELGQWLKTTKLAYLKQIHSNKVIEITKSHNLEAATFITEGDALFTELDNTAVGIFTADCVPLLAYGDGIVGACHGGWRGISSGIIENWIGAMGSCGAKKENLNIAIGPCIEKCHFEVGKDVAELILKGIPVKFLGMFKSSHPDPKKEYVDLKELARFKLMALGIPQAQIKTAPQCTYCSKEDLPSYRRQGKNAGRIQAFIVNSAD